MRSRTARATALTLVLGLALGAATTGAHAASKAKAKTTKAKSGAAGAAGSGGSGTAPALRLDPADRDLGGIVPAMPNVPGWLNGRPGSMYFAMHLRGYQGTSERMIIHGLEDETAPCWRFDDSGGFAFATVLPGAIAWDPVRGTSNLSVATYAAIVHNWRSHEPTGCETSKWDDTGRAAGTVSVRFEPNSIAIDSFVVSEGVECKGGCPADWHNVLGPKVTLTPQQKKSLADPKVPEVVIPIRYRNTFSDDSPDTGTSQPCFYTEEERKDVDCTWVGASQVFVHLIRLPSQTEFNRIVQSTTGKVVAMQQEVFSRAAGGGGGASSSSNAVPSTGVGSPIASAVACTKDPAVRRCMPTG